MKYRDRSEMKDSGVEWLGEMPREWEVKKLKYVSIINNGATPKTSNDKYWEGNINWYTPMDFGRRYLGESVRKITRLGLKSCGTTLVPRNTIIITCRAPIGNLAITVFSNSTHNQGCKSITTYNVHQKFTYYCLTAGKDFVISLGKGTTFTELSSYDLKNIKVACPCANNQQKIANFLDFKTVQFDSIISKKEQLIKKLEEAKKSLISEVVTGKVKIVDGKLVERKPAEMKDSGIEWLGMIPEGWEIKKIKHLVIKPLKYGVNELAETDNINLPRYIRITDFTETGELKEDTFKSLEYKKARGYMLNEGDILFARSGATVGKTFQFKGYNGEACFAGYLIKATVNEKISKSDFLYYFTKSLIYENWKNRIFIQATIQNISADKYKELKLAIPPMHEQNNICDYVRKNNNKYMNLEGSIKNQIQKLKQAKQSLISEVVTGKIDLRDWEIVEPA